MPGREGKAGSESKKDREGKMKGNINAFAPLVLCPLPDKMNQGYVLVILQQQRPVDPPPWLSAIAPNEPGQW